MHVFNRPEVVAACVAAAARNALATRSWIRVADFFTPEAADALATELAQGLEYERVEYGDLTCLWRGRRPVGDSYFGPLLVRSGWQTTATAAAALRVFESSWFVRWLSAVAGIELRFLRPPTPYRLSQGDRICLHDDMSDPEHAVSVACNLTGGWAQGMGGETIVGRVSGTHRAPTPANCPIELQEWRIHPGGDVLPPQFNSLLVLRLSEEYAHGVKEVRGRGCRYSITTIYGRA